MPCESFDELEVGRYYGIAFEGHRNTRKVFKFTGIEEDSAVLKGSGDEGGKDRWSYPSSIYTADETEEILYHCSFCGAAGHNRRTCPKVTGVEIKTGDEMEKSYLKGKRIDNPMLICNVGDLVMVENVSPTVAITWEKNVYEVVEIGSSIRCQVVENYGDHTAGAFGKEWAFDFGNWHIYEVIASDSSSGEYKPLPIWKLIETVLPVSRLTLLYGPPGTGKTTAGNYMGDPKEVYNLTLTEETPAAELRGHFIPKGHEFVWMDGPALTAFKKGARLVLNEIDKASGDALTFCHALLDDPGIAKITLPYKDEDGESVSVSPHPDFNVVATMNGEPDDLPEALRDRFAVRINVDKVHPDAIKALPEDLRKIASKGVSKEGERSISIRGWNAFVQLREIVGEDNAATAVFGPRAKTILNTIKIDGLSAKVKK